MNILISGRPSGRITSKLKTSLEIKGHSVAFQENIWDSTFIRENIHAYDVYIAAAWKTKGDYKEDPINEEYAKYTNLWLDLCREKGVYTIYLGTSDMSGFEDCLYHRCKNMCDPHADTVLKIPYVWQPNRVGSLAWKVANGKDYELSPGLFSYTDEDTIVETVLNVLFLHSLGSSVKVLELGSKPEPLETWIHRFS